MKAKIYALKDPDTGRVRYVGQTIHSPDRRLRAHWYGRTDDDTPKNQWLRRLEERGQRPTIEVLEEVSGGQKYEAEKEWIADLINAGEPLLNHNQLPGKHCPTCTCGEDT